jgi:hypothetical protein
MTHKGGCHCGRIAFEIEGEIPQLMDCNCSICTKRGYLHWFVPNDQVHMKTPAANIATYTFMTGKFQHQFCPSCGCAPFVISTDGSGTAVNVRCLEGVDLSRLEVQPFDGRSPL